jgi:hypothetical protein
MRQNMDLEVIFPIKDSASADLMLRKAEHLYQAGVIGRAERQAVIARYLDMVMCQPEALER